MFSNSAGIHFFDIVKIVVYWIEFIFLKQDDKIDNLIEFK